MSSGYAQRLSDYPNKGICGLAESRDSARVFKSKMNQLRDLVEQCNHIVVLTGAGISTAAGIPDFRGPRGIWTMEKTKGKSRKRKANGKGSKKDKRPRSGETHSPQGQREDLIKSEESVDNFSNVKPTFTHRALAELTATGNIKFVVTQNVDGLHQRAGMERRSLAILHGCVFEEKCSGCERRYFRDYDVGTISFQPTGRSCDDCKGILRDTLLDWEDPLPEDELEAAESHCRRADLVICLGTSLRIEPAGSLPLLAKQFCIVNLQPTPKDNSATLVIRAKVDDVMSLVSEQLRSPMIPEKGDGIEDGPR